MEGKRFFQTERDSLDKEKSSRTIQIKTFFILHGVQQNSFENFKRTEN